MGSGVPGAKEEGSRTEMRPVTNISASHLATAESLHTQQVGTVTMQRVAWQ